MAILTTLTRDVRCEKSLEDESLGHEPCYARYEKPLKNHPLDWPKNGNAFLI